MGKNHNSLLRTDITTNGLTNAFFNGVICWWLINEKGPLGWWGGHSFGVDLLATGFILPLIVALIVVPLQRRKVRSGKIAPLASAAVTNPYLRLFSNAPTVLWKTSLYFGIAGVVIISLPTLALLWVVGIEQFSAGQFAIFKGLWAGVLAASLTGPMVLLGWRAQDDTPNPAPSPTAH